MKIIAFEGIDASGKETQARMLAEALEDEGYLVELACFPRKHTPVGKLIRSVLIGDVEMGDEAFHLLYEVDRAEHFAEIEGKMNRLDYLILDRYTMSNIAYAMAGGKVNPDWLFRVQTNLLKPDVTFLLSISVEESFRRRDMREDKFEENKEFLTKVSSAYTNIGRNKSLRNSDNPVITIDAEHYDAKGIHEAILPQILEGKFW